jgi:cell division protein FtsW
VVLYTDIIPYAGERVAVWKDPFGYPNANASHQTRQSLYAIGSGGLLGLGLGNSRQKYLYLPEPQNDFIFAVVCEELGLVGATIIIGLYCALVWRGMTIAKRAQDRFGALLATGLTAQVGIQTFLNIAVVTSLFPNTGISLPFFSYGGTSLVMLLAEMGLVLSVSRNARMDKA